MVATTDKLTVTSQIPAVRMQSTGLVMLMEAIFYHICSMRNKLMSTHEVEFKSIIIIGHLS